MPAPMPAPAAPQQIWAVSPDGQVGLLDPSVAQDFIENRGFRMATPAEMQIGLKGMEYSGTGAKAAAFSQGALETLTFGGSNALLQAAGQPAEYQRDLSKYQPGYETAGKVTGAVLPALLTAGASAAPEAAAMAGATAPGLIGRAGAAVTKAVAGAGLPGVAGRVLPTAAGMAVEGGLFAAGDVAGRAILKDPELDAQKALSEVGFGAVLGGALGGGGKLLGEMVPTGVTEKLSDWLGEVAGNRANKAAGAIQSDLNKTLKRMSRDDLNALGQRAVENGWVTPLSTPAETFEKTAAALKNTGEEMGALLEKASAAEGAPTFEWGNVRQTIEEGVLKPLREKASTLPAVKQAEGILENFSQVYGERSLTLSDLHAIRKDLDAIIYQHGRAVDPFAKAVAEPLKGVRDVIAKALETGVESTEVGQGQAWRALNAAYRDAKVINGFAEKGMLRAEGNNLLSLTETMGGLTGLATHGLSGGVLGAVGTAALRRHSSGTIAWAATGAQRFLQRLVEGAEGRMSGGVGALFGETARRAGAEGSAVTASNFTKVATELQEHASDATRLAEAATRQTSALNDHAPDHAVAMQMATARAVSHLAAKLPKPTDAMPLDGQYRPSKTELAEFNRHLQAAQAPLDVLKHVGRGTLTPEHMETLKTVYPRLLAEMQAKTLERLAEHISSGKQVPFKVRQSLAAFLEQPLDSGVVMMARNQAAMAASRQAQQAQQSANAQALTLANRTDPGTTRAERMS